MQVRLHARVAVYIRRRCCVENSRVWLGGRYVAYDVLLGRQACVYGTGCAHCVWTGEGQRVSATLLALPLS
jgi:hypothetical protein